MKKTEDLKITFLGVNPVLQNEDGSLDPQSICALGALMTFKGKTAEELKKETESKGKDLNEKVKTILRKSSLKGHASMATTPVFSFSYEASKFLDSAMTGMVFSSSLMASGRRTDSDYDDIVIPSSMENNEKAKEIYIEASRKNLDVFNNLLKDGVEKDQASKILQYGIYGTGIISYSIESFNSLKREYEREKEWMPEEIGMLLKQLEEEFKKTGVYYLFKTRQVAPRNIYPYPNIFKNPDTTNLVRDIVKDNSFKGESAILSIDSLVTSGLEQRMNELKGKLEKAYQDKEYLKENWFDLLEERASISRDYQNALNVKILSRESWRVWGDKKRHRTVPMTVDSMYYSIDRAYNIYKQYEAVIVNNTLGDEAVKELDNVFAIPNQVKENKEFLKHYTVCALDSLIAYKKLVEEGIPERDAIFIIPRGIRIDMINDYNLYNIIAGYYPLRLCKKAEEQLREVTKKEIEILKAEFEKRGLAWLNWHIQPKCYTTGFCHEESSCFWIRKDVPFYDENVHNEMKEVLENKFKESLEE